MAQGHVELTKFEKIELLRQEFDERKEQLSELRAQIRDIEFEAGKFVYLKGVSPFYEGVAPKEDPERLRGLKAQEETLSELLAVLKGEMVALGVSADDIDLDAPASPRGTEAASGSKKSKFASFEEFQQGHAKG